MGSVAATASVGAAVEVEAVEVAASPAVSVEGVTGGVGDSDDRTKESSAWRRSARSM